MSAVSALVVGFMIQQYRYQLMMIIGGTWSKVDEFSKILDFLLGGGAIFMKQKSTPPPNF